MIAAMKKLTLAALDGDIDELCHELVWLQAVEVVPFEASCVPEGTVFSGNRNAFTAAEKRLAAMESAIGTLAPFGSGAKPLFVTLDRAQYDEVGKMLPEALRISDETAAVTARLAERQAHMTKIAADIACLEPFEAFDEPAGFEGTAHTLLLRGTFPKLTPLDPVREALDGTGIDYELSPLCVKGDYQYVIALCHRKDSEPFCKALNAEGFSRLSFSGFTKSAREEIAALREALAEEKKQADTEKQSYRKLAMHLETLEKARDYLAGLLEKERIKDALCATEKARILTGWVPEKRLDDVKKVLDAFDCSYEFSDPTEEDKPPVLLDNGKFATPFESVLALYSYPSYRGFDPTTIMSVFYFVIFGLIMQDIGYGLLLVFGCQLLKKLRHPPKGGMMAKLLDMFTLCGISTAVCGVLFGGFFGDLPVAIANRMLGIEFAMPALLNPVEQPMPYLAISLALGAIHLIAGLVVKAYMLIRDGHAFDAVCDVFTWLAVFLGAGLCAIVPKIGIWVVVAGLAGLILTQGRAEKNPVMKFLKGLISLYDIVSYLSDLLSYSRIMALGLSGVIIGQVVNTIGTLGGPTAVGFIVLILAFVLGHALNFALSLLGAFVHTARLQYIEFLGKFYEDGGEEFKPSRAKTKYSELLR